jgi:hypothetical protein
MLRYPAKLNPGFVGKIVEGVEILDGISHPGPIPATLAQEASPQRTRSEAMQGNRNASKTKNSGDKVTAVFGRGNDVSYLTARIARDHPDILERMKAGAYKSVRAAAKEAGIVKDLTPLQQVQRAWKRATDDDKQLIAGWIRDNALPGNALPGNYITRFIGDTW